MPRAEVGKVMSSQVKKWKQFERLVAALQKAENENAVVTWNDSISGRQFDVTIRFKQGLDDYLTVVECKDYADPVPVGDVEAFVTKSRRARADKAIIFSASGFQSGAKKVAQAEKVSLYTVAALNEFSDEELLAKFAPFVCNIFFFRFREVDPTHFSAFPEEPAVLRLMMRGTTIVFPDGTETTPETLLKAHVERIKALATESLQTYEMEFPTGTYTIDVNRINRDHVTAFLVDYLLVPIKLLKSTRGLGSDPYLSGDVYELTNESMGGATTFDKSELRHGFDTKMVAGTYYTNPNLGFYYYCESVGDSSAKMWLIESNQGGGLLQAIASVPLSNTAQFVEVTDKTGLARLKTIHDSFKTLTGKNDES